MTTARVEDRPMQAASPVRVIRSREMLEGPPTPGLSRKLAEVDEFVTIAAARNEAYTTSDWHHHGDHTACVFVAQGQVRIEWGPGGREHADVDSGDFYVVSPNTIHREGNPGAEEQKYGGVFVGSGSLVTNVVGPPDE